MGYIKEFSNALEAKLSSLPEEARKEIVTFAAQEVLTSYRNGLRDAKRDRLPAKTDERSSPRRQERDAAPRSRRNYQQR